MTDTVNVSIDILIDMLSRHHSTDVVCLRLEINQIHQTKNASVCYLFSRQLVRDMGGASGEAGAAAPSLCTWRPQLPPPPHV